ncbi:MAG: hypothetical protein LBJ18_03700 [Rickettsiales bacterium]|nr:hypothetical protein [Rickettsiales bacterium]
MQELIKDILTLGYNRYKENRKFQQKMLTVVDKLDVAEIVLKRLEFLNCYQHKGNYQTLCKLYDEYKKLGGNSYIDDLFLNYKKGQKK